jgi:hypothetical protein
MKDERRGNEGKRWTYLAILVNICPGNDIEDALNVLGLMQEQARFSEELS